MKSLIRKINYYETDQMAVVHHSNYIRYFEEARTFLMDSIGYPYDKLEKEGIISPVLRVSCEYKKPAHYGDTVVICIHLVEMNKVKCCFKYEILDNETKELRATGESEHCFLNRDGRVVSIMKTNPEFYAMLVSELEPIEK